MPVQYEDIVDLPSFTTDPAVIEGGLIYNSTDKVVKAGKPGLWEILGSGSANSVAFRATLGGVNTGNIFTNGGYVKVPFNTDSGSYGFDTHGFFDTSLARFQPKTAGYYSVGGRIMPLPQMNGARGIPVIYKNGNEYARVGVDYMNGDDAQVGGHALVYLNGSTDFVELFFHQTISGGAAIAVRGDASYTYFEGQLVLATSNPSQPASSLMRIGLNAAASVPSGVWTKTLVSPFVVHDNASMPDATNRRMYARQSGVYSIKANAYLATNGVSFGAFLALLKNWDQNNGTADGAAIARTYEVGNGEASLNLSIDIDVWLNEGDYIEPAILQGSGAARSLFTASADPLHTFMSMTRQPSGADSPHPSPWQTVAPINSVVVYAGLTAQWRKRPDGAVDVRGELQAPAGGVTAATPILQLPANVGARPTRRKFAALTCTTGVKRFYVNTDGNIYCDQGLGANEIVHGLDGLSGFYID